jgi:hypothetical protein
MSNILIWVKKRLVWGVLEREERDKYNETSLKEGGGIEMSTTVLSIFAMHALFALNTYLSHNLLPNFVLSSI